MGMEYERLNNLSLAQHVSAILSQDSSCRFWLQQCSALYGVQDGWLFMRVAVCAKITPHSQCKMCNVAVSFLSSGSKLDVSIVLQKECCSVYNMPRTSCLTPFPCCACSSSSRHTPSARTTLSWRMSSESSPSETKSEGPDGSAVAFEDGIANLLWSPMSVPCHTHPCACALPNSHPSCKSCRPTSQLCVCFVAFSHILSGLLVHVLTPCRSHNVPRSHLPAISPQPLTLNPPCRWRSLPAPS